MEKTWNNRETSQEFPANQTTQEDSSERTQNTQTSKDAGLCVHELDKNGLQGKAQEEVHEKLL